MAFILIVLGIVCGWLWWAVESDPVWWQPPDPTSQAVADLGHGTEQFVLEQIHKPREVDDRWRIRLLNDQMNAWLAVNLPAWFSHETGDDWPEEVSFPTVSAEESGFNLGFRVPEKFGDRVIGLQVLPSIVEEDGRLKLELTKASLGRAPLPAPRMILDLIRERFKDEIDDQALDVIAGIVFGDETLDPQLELTDGRLVELINIELEEDALVLTCRTLRESDAPTDESTNTDPVEEGETGDQP